MSHLGVDLSNYQGDVTSQELTALKKAGVQFAYVKLTQGTDYLNPDCKQQVDALRSAGIKVGLYHFYDPTVSPTAQAQYVIINAAGVGGSDLPLGLDCESTDPSGWQDLAWKMVAFAMQVEGDNGPLRSNTTIFYVNVSFYDNLPGFPWGRGVWLADPSHDLPSKPCLVWQGKPGPEGGFSSIDPDAFWGTESQWQAFISGSVSPPTSSTPPTPTATGPISSQPSTPVPPSQEFDLSTLPNLSTATPGGSKLTESVQALLRDKFNQTQLGVNGNYGTETVAAVNAVREFLKLPLTGEVDAGLWEILLTL